MPIAHACASCGRSLTHLRAPADPIYGLPIIVCPACGTAVVRRRHPLAVWAHQGRRIACSLAALGLNASLLAFATLGFAGVSRSLARTFEDAAITPFRWLLGLLSSDGAVDAWREGESGPINAIGWVCASVFCGAWLTAAAPHLRRSTLLLVWIGLTLLAVLTPAIEEALRKLDQPERAWEPVRLLPPPGIIAGTALVCAFAAALLPLGIPLGLAVRRAVRRTRRAQPARTRARKRARRHQR